MQMFKIDGNPISQQRPRLGRRGFAYDPNCRDKTIVKALFRQWKTDAIYPYPRISFVFIMPIPKSCSAKVVDRYNKGMVRHCKKPDIDNLIKFYLDCMDGIIFEGDQSVSLGECFKVYGSDPATLIYIQNAHEDITLQEIRNLQIEFPVAV